MKTIIHITPTKFLSSINAVEITKTRKMILGNLDYVNLKNELIIIQHDIDFKDWFNGCNLIVIKLKNLISKKHKRLMYIS